MCDWIKWNERSPTSPDEVGYVIFRNEITGNYWMQNSSVVQGPYWYDETPIAWTPMPEMPDFIPVNKYKKG